MAQKHAHKKPLRYLEVGGGSGALTQYLIQNMQLRDSLDIVENDPKFCSILRQKFAHLPQVTIHEISVLDFPSEKYDVLISSLPLNAFRAPMVHDIFKKYETLVEKGGYLSYFEYLGVEKVKQALLFGENLADFRDTLALKEKFVIKYGKEIDKIWWNFPPARVIHCQM